MAEEMDAPLGADEPDEQDDLRNILGDGPVPFPTKAEREFQPWHRPRKQYVRRMQWSREINILARDLKLQRGQLRYLTLPGNDLLDIRHIVEAVCARNNMELRYLGFNNAANPASSAQSELNSAQFSVNRLECINSESQVVPGDFRMVASHRSQPYQRIRQEGPFHAINIDLCGGFAGKEKALGIPNYFAALQVLLQNQERTNEDFLLFITTRMDDDNIEEETKRKLTRIVEEISDTCSGYSEELSTLWGLPHVELGQKISEVATTAELFMLGLTQWIISCGVRTGLKASVRSFMTYRTGTRPGEDDIVSLAIRFKPDPIVREDPHGLTQIPAEQVPEFVKECEQSFRVPRRVHDRVRVDDVIREQADEFEVCISESSSLLGSAGYDVSAYRNWAVRQERIG
ncbi:PP_RS20740 family protein [Actinacidiphila epipremni]|uniref:Uncharacterized protein n=1 Tax=Actinacidiphila epipremni TaxID=2053013 RepID=A0ABX0ZQ69_9ACTN|nr:F-BAR domain-containing protein [Actinacidiphila epipremni]NJP46055.1 hypothetical protein [Actinacidiphila epipremni]